MKKINEKYFINTEKMNSNSIESLLSSGEEILWQGKPYRKSFILSSIFRYFFIALIWLAFDGTAIGFIIGFRESIPWFAILIISIFFLFHLIPVWLWIYDIISASKRQKLEDYVFTDQRIIVKKGFIGANIVSIYYSSLVSINLKIGIIEKMCKVGDIYIVSQNSKIVLEDIKDPYFIATKLQKIAHDIKTDVLFPNALRPKENKGYNTKYTKNN